MLGIFKYGKWERKEDERGENTDTECQGTP